MKSARASLLGIPAAWVNANASYAADLIVYYAVLSEEFGPSKAGDCKFEVTPID